MGGDGRHAATAARCGSDDRRRLHRAFAPAQVDYSVRVGLLSYGSYSFWQLIHWPPGWSWAFLPMLIIGVTLVLSGIVLTGGVRELRRRLLGAAVTTVGVFTVLFAPAHQIICGDCPNYGL